MKKIIIAWACVLVALPIFSQQPDYISGGALLDGKTMVKVNATSLFLKTGGVSAERIITKNLSAVVGISFMPATSFPFVNTISTLAGVDQETQDLITSVKFNTFSFSPELRIYPGKGYGRGFYLSPYYKYERFGIKNFAMEVDINDENGQPQTQKFGLGGGINTNSFGLMLGYQWLVGKKRNIIIDWTMFGVHYGGMTGNLHANYEGSITLTDEDRATINTEINNTLGDLPLINASAIVNKDNSVDATLKGPWAFLRGSLSVGFRF